MINQKNLPNVAVVLMFFNVFIAFNMPISPPPSLSACNSMNMSDAKNG